MVEDVGKFVAMAIQQMEKVHGKPKEKVDSGKTGDGQSFHQRISATKSYPQWERVAYIQLPTAVGLSYSPHEMKRAIAKFSGAQRST
jgi:hypothetical protein